MELVTASDLFVTVSLTLLLSVIVAKLVSLAMTSDPTTQTHNPTISTKHHVHDHQLGTLQVQEVCSVPDERLTVQSAQSEKRVEFLSPIQVAINAETEPHDRDEEGKVEFESNVVDEVSNVGVLAEERVEEKIKEADEEREELCDQAVEGVEEISVEPGTEMGISVEESGVKERDDDEDNDDIDDDDDDDDWEGIERSEVEKVFMAATEFVVGEGDGLASIGSDVRMELYGLHKVAMEGPCREPQPMPLKLSARAKWNAWQKLGNMSPEVAMEQYVSLLSDKVPGWMKDTSTGMSEHEPTGSEATESAAPDVSASLSDQQMILTERELEQESDAQNHSPLAESDLENNVKK